MAKKKKSGLQQISTPAEIAEAHLEALESGKQGYKAADLALEMLLKECRTTDCPTCGASRLRNGGIVKLANGQTFRIVDKFADKDTTNVGQNVRRYAVETVSA